MTRIARRGAALAAVVTAALSLSAAPAAADDGLVATILIPVTRSVAEADRCVAEYTTRHLDSALTGNGPGLPLGTALRCAGRIGR
ncbi:hypothetical protein ACQUSR_30235 [Streptomyces sp. P1-3]|uniref:hypothetical protein n=1 Tax=Streptomyces sp. P1-3 TaxID=3421658 RepID=UPI003D36E3C0